MLKILFFGDVMGSIGRQAIIKVLPDFKKKYKPDLVMINGENLAHGKGVTSKIIKQMQSAGIDFLTSGNHIYSKNNTAEIFSSPEFNIIAPANDPRTPQNCGYRLIQFGKKTIIVLNLLGKTFIDEENIKCPFKTLDKLLKEIKKFKANYIILDFHAEATSEKVALGHYADGRLDAILGTHTHVQTNDARQLPQGTLYISDIGMVGAQESVIGIDKKIIIDKFLNDSKIVFDIPLTGKVLINAVLLELNKKSSKIKVIKEKTVI
jgi:2',3'-cyclic-nucleotide 2'-phosphodiesterase